MKNCKACLLAAVAFLAAGAFAKPVLNVLKISSSGETALIQKGPSVTTNSFGHVYSVVGSDEELTVENAPSWLKEVKSKQDNPEEPKKEKKSKRKKSQMAQQLEAARDGQLIIQTASAEPSADSIINAAPKLQASRAMKQRF